MSPMPEQGINQQHRVVAGLAISIILLLLAYHFLLPWKEVERDHGYTRDARLNPFLAATQYLKHLGIESQVDNSLAPLNALPLPATDDEFNFPTDVGETEFEANRDVLIVTNSYGLFKDRRFKRAWEFVNNGGTLVVSARNPFMLGNTIDDELFEALGVYSWEPEDDADSETVDEFDPEELREDDAAEETDAEGGSDAYCTVYYDDRLAINLPDVPETIYAQLNDYEGFGFYEAAPDVSATLDDTVYFAQYEIGDGTVVVTSTTEIWDNRSIDEDDHAFLLYQLVKNKGTVRFLLNREAPAISKLLWDLTPVAVIAALLSLLLWLLKVSVRLGPAYAFDTSQRRSFAEHLQANAQFLFRNKKHGLLIQHIRKNILQQLHLKHPQFDALETAAKIHYLQQFSRRKPGDIHEAMLQPIDDIQQDYFTVAQHLKEIRDKL